MSAVRRANPLCTSYTTIDDMLNSHSTAIVRRKFNRMRPRKWISFRKSYYLTNLLLLFVFIPIHFMRWRA